MKSLINMRAGAMMLMLMFLSGTSAWADVDDYLLSVRDVSHTANTIDFDLYLLDADNAQTFEFAALQMGLLLNSAIYGVGTLTVSYDNTGSGLDGDQQFVGSVDIVGSLTGYPGQTLIRLMPNSIPPVPPGAGSGTVISSIGNGTLLAHFTITSSINFTPNTRPDLVFCASSAVSPLFPTVLSSYINGDAASLAVTPLIDAIVDGNPLLNATLPAIFNVTGTGTYCQGGEGIPVGLDDSESNTIYTLYRSGLEVTSLDGDGDALSFNNQTEGTYTIYATNDAGSRQMNGEAVITAVINAVGPSSSTPTLCINTLMTSITHTTSGATGIGAATGLPTGVSASWESNTITISGTPEASGTFNYSIPLTGGCGSVNASGTITVTPANTISLTSGVGTNDQSVCVNTAISNITYSTTGATGAAFSGLPTGVNANWSANIVTISGTPTLEGTYNYSITLTGGCGNITANGTITVNSCLKTLTLSSVLLEGLYNGSGMMRQAQNASGAQWPVGVADHITVELHHATNYSNIVWSATDVPLSITGSAIIAVPPAYSGTYFITIRHRNSIETTTSTAVSFAGSSITRSYALRSSVFGSNLGSSGDGLYVIYGADVNQDGIVDTGDMNEVDNGSTAILIGYNLPDANGDGIVDTSDMNIVDNNSTAIIMIRLP